MRRLATLLLSLGLILGLAAPAAAAPTVLANSSIVVLGATMTGEAEVPGPGDPDGVGISAFLLNLRASRLCYIVAVQNITLPATGNHIHIAPPTAPGPVVVPLANPDESGIARGCVSVDPVLLSNIASNPGNYYVNVHTLPLYAAGAVRGQLFNPLGSGPVIGSLGR